MQNMRENWEKLQELSRNISEDKFEVWMKETTNLISTMIENIFPMADEENKTIILQELQDITSAMEVKDMVLLEDAIRYGFLDTTEEYCL